MISDVELDRVLKGFISDGGDRAPKRDVERALSRVAVTPQRRRRPWSPGAMRQKPSSRWVVVAAALLILAAGIAAWVGAEVLREVVPPRDDVPPAPSPALVKAAPSLVRFEAEDWAVRLDIPAGWSPTGPATSAYRHFTGDEPEGHLSVTNENPFGTTICSPDCADFQVPITIPYDPIAQLAGLKASVGKIAGGDTWSVLPADVLPDLQGGSRLDTTTIAPDGREWRRVHVVGLRARNVVAIAWSQPAEVFDESLLDSILDGIVLTEAPVYIDGDLAPRDWTEFTMSVPGIWGSEEQPMFNGVVMSGVRRLAEGRVLVSFGGSDGGLGWCDPECRQFDDLTTLDALEAAIRSGSGLGPSMSITLDGEPARSMTIDSPVARRIVIAMHDERPVAILLDAGEWDVGPGIFDEMIESFAFARAVKTEPPDQILTTAGGRVRLGLSDEWNQSDEDDGAFVKWRQRMTVRAGDDHGSITTCSNGAGPWDRCREITPTSLDELADAVQPGPLDDHGVGPPTGHRDATTLGGEPAVVTRIHAYEYPARGGQEVVYIVAMHDGRPYIVRIHTREDYVQGLELIIAGFTFVD